MAHRFTLCLSWLCLELSGGRALSSHLPSCSLLATHLALPCSGFLPCLTIRPGLQCLKYCNSGYFSPASKLDANSTLGQGRCNTCGQWCTFFHTCQCPVVQYSSCWHCDHVRQSRLGVSEDRVPTAPCDQVQDHKLVKEGMMVQTHLLQIKAGIVPHRWFISTWEQRREPPNKSYQYLIVHASSDIPLSLHGLFPDQVIQTSNIIECCDI